MNRINTPIKDIMMPTEYVGKTVRAKKTHFTCYDKDEYVIVKIIATREIVGTEDVLLVFEGQGIEIVDSEFEIVIDKPIPGNIPVLKEPVEIACSGTGPK